MIARTEALIAGQGQEEALKRGQAYAEAGADAVLIHSKQKTPDEILAFCRAWPGRVPLVLVPTSYPQLSFAEVAALEKVGLIICGNHAIRAAVLPGFPGEDAAADPITRSWQFAGRAGSRRQAARISGPIPAGSPAVSPRTGRVDTLNKF